MWKSFAMPFRSNSNLQPYLDGRRLCCSIPKSLKYGILGCGNIGESLIRSALINLKWHKDITSVKKSLIVSSRRPERLHYIENTYKIATTVDNKDLAKQCDVIYLCVKPFQIKDVCNEIKDVVDRSSIVVSTAAGVTCANLAKWLHPGQKIVRCMPNLGTYVGLGVTAFYSPGVTEYDVYDIFVNRTRHFWVTDENKLDTITALSGCGPAWMTRLYEAFYEIGLSHGLSTEESDFMIAMTMESTGALLNHIPSTRLINMVASKGGATEAGLNKLNINDCMALLQPAIETALDRVKEMKDKMD